MTHFTLRESIVVIAHLKLLTNVNGVEEMARSQEHFSSITEGLGSVPTTHSWPQNLF